METRPDLMEEAPSNRQSYREIAKATSLFGGVSAFQILLQLVRSKIVAVLLGPSGMGIIGLLTSALSLIGGFTNFGLSTSAVKDVAAANGSGRRDRIVSTVNVLRRLVWVTGLLGTVVTAALSPLLSKLAFGNSDYTVAFLWISITLLLNQLSSGQLVVLQGMRKLKLLAKANVTGSALSIACTLPLYFRWHEEGIVPAILVASVINLLISWVYARKQPVEREVQPWKESWAKGRDMLKMGFLISLTGILELGTAFVVRTYINHNGGEAQVGLFTAGFAIINTYVGMVFNSMSTDYFPRLSAVAHDSERCRRQISQQAEVAILILTPILILLVVFIKWLILLLYSGQFTAVSGLIHWAAPGMLFKAVGWAVGFQFLAKGQTKTFFWSELVAILYTLSLNLAGYQWWGLTGVGFSFLVSYFLVAVQVWIIAKKQSKFHFEKGFARVFLINLVLLGASVAAVRLLPENQAYLPGAACFLASAAYSGVELDRRMNWVSFLRNFLNRYLKR